MRKIFRVVAALGVGLLFVSLGGLLAGVYWYQQEVVKNPGEHLERRHIMGVIAQESPVYYRDGFTPIGVFFDDEHRQFVSWEELPQPYVMAIVAAEDGDFWTHSGINMRGIARAMRDNLRAGGLVAGGSTLTQQTAKNIYYRPDRSLKSKWTELVNAMRLEAHYSKAEILTFYVNQFHVTGNGRGLGIAARHFFDKEVEDLTVLECAFLAGLVKAPSYYDPFIGDKARRERAVDRAHVRTEYVLRRLIDEPIENLSGPTAQEDSVEGYSARLAAAQGIRSEARRLLNEGFVLEFKRGIFRYDSSAILDEVGRRLTEAPFDDVLERAGIEDPATAGLKVITTLDPDIQRISTYGLWHHLTEVGLWLEARTAKDFIQSGRGPRYEPSRPLIQGEFRSARIVEKLSSPKSHFSVDLGGTGCLVDRDALVRVAVATYRGQEKNRYAKAPGSFVDAFIAAFSVDDLVWVSVRDQEAALCDLELRPELQGALVVLEDGQLRGLVGGNDNRNFNRASALRQMGSTWKTLVFHAAMELGWTPDEVLDNSRNVFPYSTTFYYPRADHEPADRVTIAWAGVNSENLASIWLLYHLVDRLDVQELGRLAAELGLARLPDEEEDDYRLRIQKAGILPTPRRVSEAHFLQARQEVLAGDLLLEHPEEAVALQSLLYGWGFHTEMKRVQKGPAKDRGWKLSALENSWVLISPMLGKCRQQYHALSSGFSSRRFPAREAIADLSVWVDGKAVRVACGAMPNGYAFPDESLMDELGQSQIKSAGETWALTDLLTGNVKPEESSDAQSDRLHLVPVEDVLVNGRLRLATLTAVGDAMRRRELARELAISDVPDLYSPELLYWHQDFRLTLSMRYLSALARKYGVQTKINEVLSMPLGASEATLEEITMLYNGLVTGKRWTFPGEVNGEGLFDSNKVDSPAASTLLIAEIRDVDDRVIYRVTPELEEVADISSAEMTADILANVVTWGTGRRAAEALKEESGYVPLGGKTGTTNDYRNSAFVGFAPKWSDRGGYVVEDGLIVGAYVGYDDNRKMSVGRTRIAGSSGALPAWIEMLKGAHALGFLGESTGEAPSDGWGVLHSHRVRRISVDAAGLPLTEQSAGEDGRTVLVPMPDWTHAFETHFEPQDLDEAFRDAMTVEEGLEEFERRRGDDEGSVLWGEVEGLEEGNP